MEDSVLRFTSNQRVQHALLMLCLIILALTGLSLMYHDTILGRFMIQLEGGFQARGRLHRWAAVVLILVSGYHHLHTLFSASGYGLFHEFLLRNGDWAKAAQSVRFDLSQFSQRPAWGKFTLFQKLQYFGVVMGVLTMIGTGVILWLGPPALALLPKWIIDLTMVVHGREGLLIFLLLLFWHLYNVHLAPGNFPMNMSWITGRISADECSELYPQEYSRLLGEAEKKA